MEAINQPYKLDEVKAALEGIGIWGIIVLEARGHDRQKGHTEVYRGQEYRVDLLPKVKRETVVADRKLPQLLEVLKAAARTGKIGGGKIFVPTIDDAIRIRNGDRGESAL